jgi:hypothetical protein
VQICEMYADICRYMLLLLLLLLQGSLVFLRDLGGGERNEGKGRKEKGRRGRGYV